MGHTALGLQRHFEEVELADNPALGKSVGPGSLCPVMVRKYGSVTHMGFFKSLRSLTGNDSSTKIGGELKSPLEYLQCNEFMLNITSW